MKKVLKFLYKIWKKYNWDKITTEVRRYKNSDDEFGSIHFGPLSLGPFISALLVSAHLENGPDVSGLKLSGPKCTGPNFSGTYKDLNEEKKDYNFT